jgi:hypothetical protein
MEENLAERKTLFMHRAVWGRKCGSRVILQSNSCFIYHSAQHSAISFYLTQDKNFFVASSFERKVFRVEEKNFASLKPFTSVNYSRFTFLGLAPCNDMHNLCADSHVPLWFETFLEHFLPTLWRGGSWLLGLLADSFIITSGSSAAICTQANRGKIYWLRFIIKITKVQMILSLWREMTRSFGAFNIGWWVIPAH